MFDRRIPWGYGTVTIELGVARERLLNHYHPEYVRRLLAWLDHKGGTIGIGSRWRASGNQPVGPGYAPEGKSFHQDQTYNDGFFGATAVDLVRRNPTGGNHLAVRWSDVIDNRDGRSAEAKRWGLHCFISSPQEPWHMQPIEIRGWQSWWNAGRPAPAPNYPIPTQEDPMTTRTFRVNGRAAVWRSTDGETAVRVDLENYNALGKPPVENLTTAQARHFRFVNTIDRGVIV